MKTFLLLLSLFISSSVLGQSCFPNCHERMKSNGDLTIEKNNRIIAELVGCRAPDFEVKDMKGQVLKLSALAGKVVVINFWYTSCPPCVSELPALNRLVKEYADDDVVFIALTKEGEDDYVVRKFLEKNKFDYQMVSGKYAMTEKFCVISGWPMNMVIDKKGVVRQIFAGGYVDERAETHAYELMKPMIDKCLK